MIILYELVDFIKVIRIKMFALYAEGLSTDSAKGCTLSAFVLATLSLWQCWIVAMTLRLEAVLDFAPRLTWIDL